MPSLSFIKQVGIAAAITVPLTAVAQADIRLLEPIGGVESIPTAGNSGFGVFFTYFNLLYPWIVGLGAATAVLMGVVGGIQMIQAGADEGKRSAGVNRLLLSLGGLLLLLFASTILRVLNPSFFK